jgi:thiol-disulfide isomerase/thioredoxin
LIRAGYVKRNINNVAGEIIFKKGVLVSDIVNFPFFDEIYAAMGDNVKNDPFVKSKIRSRENVVLLNEKQHQSLGEQYTDFEMKTPTGESRKLSDYVGKSDYILIDFWASWCGPCIAAVPNLKKVYEKYKDKGLEIIGVSIDRTQAAWQRGLDKIEAPWPQLCGFENNSKLGKAYHFSGIPHVLILDKTGTIIAVNLSGIKLENWLEEHFIF